MTVNQSPTRWRGPGGMVIEEMGAGPSVVFVHGGGAAGAAAWRQQWPLAARWRLLFPFRPGYGDSPAVQREDFDVDAELIAELLGPGAHLVGHSYGGVVALLAAARRPEAVWTLTVVESGSSSVARGDPHVDALERALADLAANPPADSELLVQRFFAILEPSAQLPQPLSPALLDLAGQLRRLRWPSEAIIPFEPLLAEPFPKLFITGGHSPALEAISDALALELGGQRKIIPGGHAPQNLGPQFNAALEAFLRGQSLYRS